MFRSQVTLKLRSKSLQIGASLIAGLAIMLPMQTSYAQPSYLGKISAFCTNLGSPSRITSCTDCHTSSNPSTRDATTANASRYKSGNYNSFCVVTAPAPPRTIPTPVVIPPPGATTPPPRPTAPPRAGSGRDQDADEDSSDARQQRKSDTSAGSQRRRRPTPHSDN